MILPIHIAIATTSLILAGIAYFYPSNLKIRANYVLIALTFATGFYLVWSLKPNHMAQVCISGLLYLSIAGVATYQAQKKLLGQGKQSSTRDF